MDEKITPSTSEFLEKIQETEHFHKIEFIILFGSRLGPYHLDDSDIDICMYIDEKKEELARIRLDLLKAIDGPFDIQMFQLLPLYVRTEVLKGKVIHAKNMARVYEIANETVVEWEEFYPFYKDYLDTVLS